MPDFFNGLLEGTRPKARFNRRQRECLLQDYTSREQYFRAYHAMRQRSGWCPRSYSLCFALE